MEMKGLMLIHANESSSIDINFSGILCGRKDCLGVVAVVKDIRDCVLN